MKKLIFAAVALFVFNLSNAQEGALTVGAHVGLPMADVQDSHSLNAGIDAAYMWSVDDKFSAGIAVGYTTFSGKKSTVDLGPLGSITQENPAISFIPVAASAQYLLTDSVFAGLDLGYAIGASDNNDGGLYYQPKVGYNAEAFQVFVGYKGISLEDATAASVNLGFIYKM